MIRGKIIMLRGKEGVSEDWSEFEFLALPSPADRVMIVRDDAENYGTVLAVHHHPCAVDSGGKPSAEIVAHWTGAAPRIR